MDEHALRVLEFERVLADVAAEVAFSVGREHVMAIRPTTSLEEARKAQLELAEMLLLDQQGLDVPMGGARDIRPVIDACAIGQVQDPGALLEASSTLKACVRARRAIDRVRDRVPALADIADGIADFHSFTDLVEAAVSDRGEVRDDASDALAITRRELRTAGSRLEQRAQSALQDAIRRGIVQEALLTERNGRKVIPIRAEVRGQFPGIVHDVSSSGATVFVEPMGVVEAGNAVRELQLAEEREVRRVLQRLTDALGALAPAARLAVDTLGRLDSIGARARYARSKHCEVPAPGEAPAWLRDRGEAVIVRGRHPLLRGDVVPMDFELGDEWSGVLITGPNTGGKTVALKTVGLLTLMAQAGLPLPCDTGSVFTLRRQVFADIGDEQSIEQSLSTFSSHMRNIIDILAEAGPGTLVLLDELGAGTDPTEGAALARAILETLLERGCEFVATTHHGELKAFATSDPRVRNASVEFNVETLSPTYHLTIGLPGQSNALAIARRLGLEEGVIERAEEQLSPDHFEVEKLLEEIRADRARAAMEVEREHRARAEAEAIRRELAESRDAIEEERREVLNAARHEAEQELSAVRRAAEAMRRQRERVRFDVQAADSTLKELDAGIERLKQSARPRRRYNEPAPETRDLRAGDRVRVRDIPQEGVALGEIGEDGRVEVQFGAIRMKVSLDRITGVESIQAHERVLIPREPLPTPAVTAELDLRGQRADEAVLRFESYIDEAFRAGVPYVRIIHGKGTGALRAAIREVLRDHPLVRSFEPGKQNEGGDGVTVAVLAG